MQPTTSRPIRPRKPTSRLAWLALFGVWGCAPNPELVYVDVSQAALGGAPEVENQIVFDTEGYSLTTSIPEMGSQDVYIGSAEERAVQALQLFRDAQQRAAEAVLDRLQRAYLAEAALFETTEESALDDSYKEWLEAELAELRALFVAHAEKVEPLRYQLTRIVGFPDPDPQSVRVPLVENERATKNFEAARALREQIAALVAAYRREVERRLSGLEARRQERLEWIEARGGVMREEALRRAKSEADAVSQTTLAQLERTALDPEAKLPAVPGATSSVESGPVKVPPLPTSQGPRETVADVETQLEVFLRVHGYRLSTTPKKGRDATKEFLDWRHKYEVGR